MIRRKPQGNRIAEAVILSSDRRAAKPNVAH
jgi:hypothetical protein